MGYSISKTPKIPHPAGMANDQQGAFPGPTGLPVFISGLQAALLTRTFFLLKQPVK